MPSKHARQQRQKAKAEALRPFANPEEDEEEASRPRAGDDDDDDDAFTMPQADPQFETLGGSDDDHGLDDDDGAVGSRGAAAKSGGKKKGKASKGTFQSLGLSRDVYAGVKRMGYKLPTPVQRKSMPEALAGKDIVCMARTGSGKTAAFLIPVLERLKAHSPRVGARALILSPTRELAMQTVKFARGLSHFTDLRVALLVGGDSMEDQFEALSRNPDIIIGTPGRVMHHLQEVPDFSLGSVQVVVYDEADRLFEMGFAEQLREIMRTIPEERQALLYSATLPKMLAQFARAGLRDPVLIRLDVESKISEQLCLSFFTVRSGNKTAALLHLLREVLPRDRLTIIFAATKHHVEFLQGVLTETGLPCSAIFGAMDFEARKANLERFRAGRVKYLIVTDVAARGIDVPLLDFVINYSFPPLPKLFVHRVGRAARQGRPGAALSLVDSEEVPYMVDLHLFLGRPLRNAHGATGDGYEGYALADATPDLVHYGSFPQHLLDEENEALRRLLERRDANLAAMWRVCENAMKQYRRTRPDPSRSAIRRAKELNMDRVHPLLIGANPARVAGAGATLADMKAKDDMVRLLQGFRPQQTVLEVQRSDGGSLYKGLPLDGAGRRRSTKALQGLKGDVDVGVKVMREIRKEHRGVLKRNREQTAPPQRQAEPAAREREAAHDDDEEDAQEDEQEVQDRARSAAHDGHEEGRQHADDVGGATGGTAKAKLSRAARKRLKKGEPVEREGAGAAGQSKATRDFRDAQYFMDYGVTEQEALVEDRLQPRSVEKGSEALLANRLEDALLDVQPDEALEMVKRKRVMHWDARKKKFVRATMSELGEGRGQKKLRTESGVVVSANAVPTGELYKKWQKRTNKTLAMAGADEDDEGGSLNGGDGDHAGARGHKRPSGGRGDGGGGDDRFMGFKRFRHTQVSRGGGPGHAGGRRGRDELKTAAQIEKERQKKERERERLASKGKGQFKGKSSGGGGRGGRGGFKKSGDGGGRFKKGMGSAFKGRK